jgi:hypothetical protein
MCDSVDVLFDSYTYGLAASISGGEHFFITVLALRSVSREHSCTTA